MVVDIPSSTLFDLCDVELKKVVQPCKELLSVNSYCQLLVISRRRRTLFQVSERARLVCKYLDSPMMNAQRAGKADSY